MTATQYFAIDLNQITLLLEEIEKAQPPRTAIKGIVKDLNLDIKDVSSQEITTLSTEIEERYKALHKKERREWHFSRWILGEQNLFCSILPYFCYLHELTL